MKKEVLGICLFVLCIGSTHAQIIEVEKTKAVFSKQVSNFSPASGSNSQSSLTAKCVACHGAQFEKKALGRSAVVQGWSHEQIENALTGYKDGSYGGAMKALMRGQVAALSAHEISDIAKSISGDEKNTKNDFTLHEVKNTKSLSENFEESLQEVLRKMPKPPLKTELTRGQFEKSSDFETRVAKTKHANAEALRQYEAEYKTYYPKAKNEAMQMALEMYYGRPLVSELSYDADNELFGAKVTFENNQEVKHNLLLKMPPSEAEGFYNNFSRITPVALFDFDGQNVTLESIKFPHAKSHYVAMLTDKELHSQALQIAQLENITPITPSEITDVSIAQSSYKSFDSTKFVSRNDLDTLLEKTKAAPSDPKKWLFVIGLEKYKYTDNIAYATRSAEMFTKVAQKTLGIPQQNSFVAMNEDATAQEIKTKMKLMLRRVKAGDTIYFYYNGHGVPAVDKQNEPFILSNDMMPDFVGEESAFMMKNIYKELSDSPASQVIAFVDSCFSGSTDGKSVQKGVAATRMKPKNIDFDKSKMVVLSAGKDTQYSSAYTQKEHRMFSYFVMQELLEGQRDVKNLYGKVYKNTKETTRQNYGDMRLQEPTLEGNEKIEL